MSLIIVGAADQCDDLQCMTGNSQWRQPAYVHFLRQRRAHAMARQAAQNSCFSQSSNILRE
jgi:hypothetical protein